jgi:hypothetical protein
MGALRPGISTSSERERIGRIARSYLRLPFAGDKVPGGIMEYIVAHVRSGEVLPTYDFVDVILRDAKLGWQVKSTKATTPVTWKRAKLPDQQNLISASKDSVEGRAALGKAIIDFCNAHGIESMERYDLDEIAYSRLVVYANRVRYFERSLITREAPYLFNSEEFEWEWSQPKKVTKKEQLPAFRGIHKATGDKWFAWHGLGENQLHFSGESAWWPESGGEVYEFEFPGDEDLLSLDAFISMLETTA